MIQKSYEENKKGNLYIVPTPIGNMDDITFRAIKTLKEVDLVLAEDTRVTSLLLNKFEIKKPLKTCHKFNEMSIKDEIIEKLLSGKNVAMVTDRGTPLISDPGSVLVKEIIKKNINVVALPGACAFIPALNMSGIDSDKFLFYGFLNQKESAARKELSMLNDINFTIVLYESPHRLDKTLQNILKMMGNRTISISREITKLHEEVFRGSVEEAIKTYESPKGEFVIIIEKSDSIEEYDENVILKEIEKCVNDGMSNKDAVKEVSKKYGISKNMLYNMHEGKKL